MLLNSVQVRAVRAHESALRVQAKSAFRHGGAIAIQVVTVKSLYTLQLLSARENLEKHVQRSGGCLGCACAGSALCRARVLRWPARRCVQRIRLNKFVTHDADMYTRQLYTRTVVHRKEPEPQTRFGKDVCCRDSQLRFMQLLELKFLSVSATVTPCSGITVLPLGSHTGPVVGGQDES